MHRNVLLKVAATKIRLLGTELAAIERLTPPGSRLRADLAEALAVEMEKAERLLEMATPAYRRKSKPDRTPAIAAAGRDERAG